MASEFTGHYTWKIDPEWFEENNRQPIKASRRAEYESEKGEFHPKSTVEFIPQLAGRRGNSFLAFKVHITDLSPSHRDAFAFPRLGPNNSVDHLKFSVKLQGKPEKPLWQSNDPPVISSTAIGCRSYTWTCTHLNIDAFHSFCFEQPRSCKVQLWIRPSEGVSLDGIEVRMRKLQQERSLRTASILFESSMRTDVTFVIKDNDLVDERTGQVGPHPRIEAHSAILKAGSDYFRTALESDFQEGSGSIEIFDTAYRDFRAYIFYLYTGKIKFAENDDTAHPSHAPDPDAAVAESFQREGTCVDSQSNMSGHASPGMDISIDPNIVGDGREDSPVSPAKRTSKRRRTGSVGPVAKIEEDVSCDAMGVFVLADKYDSPELKYFATAHIEEAITVKNVLPLLFSETSKLYPQLREKFMKFALSNWEQVKKVENFKTQIAMAVSGEAGDCTEALTELLMSAPNTRP